MFFRAFGGSRHCVHGYQRCVMVHALFLVYFLFSSCSGYGHQDLLALKGRFWVLELPPPCPKWLTWERVPSDARGPVCVPGLERTVKCDYFGFQYSMEWYFANILRENPVWQSTRIEDAQFIYFPHCVSMIYFGLRLEDPSKKHWDAIWEAEETYLIPLLRWAHETASHKQHDGKNFFTVFSMDLGRQDFALSAPFLQKWSVGSLTGHEHWLQQSGLLVTSGSNTSGSGCWEEDTKVVVERNDIFAARDFKPWDTVISIPSRFSPVSEARESERKNLFFFAGSPNSCARRKLLEVYGGRVGDIVVRSSVMDTDEYVKMMLSSKYCLVLRGSSHTNNVRLYDVMLHGCIPVIVSDDFQPPLDKWLPWRQFAVFVPTVDIPFLESVLRSISDRRRLEMFETLTVDPIRRPVDRPPIAAGKVFEWRGGYFWLLFFHDVRLKLQQHVNNTRRESNRAALNRWEDALLNLVRAMRAHERPPLIVDVGLEKNAPASGNHSLPLTSSRLLADLKRAGAKYKEWNRSSSIGSIVNLLVFWLRLGSIKALAPPLPALLDMGARPKFISLQAFTQEQMWETLIEHLQQSGYACFFATGELLRLGDRFGSEMRGHVDIFCGLTRDSDLALIMPNHVRI